MADAAADAAMAADAAAAGGDPEVSWYQVQLGVWGLWFHNFMIGMMKWIDQVCDMCPPLPPLKVVQRLWLSLG